MIPQEHAPPPLLSCHRCRKLAQRITEVKITFTMTKFLDLLWCGQDPSNEPLSQKRNLWLANPKDVPAVWCTCVYFWGPTQVRHVSTRRVFLFSFTHAAVERRTTGRNKQGVRKLFLFVEFLRFEKRTRLERCSILCLYKVCSIV